MRKRLRIDKRNISTSISGMRRSANGTTSALGSVKLLFVVQGKDVERYRTELDSLPCARLEASTSIPDMLEALARDSYTHILIDQAIILGDPQAWAIAQRDPHCRDLPYLVCGDNPSHPGTRNARQFLHRPLSGTALEEALAAIPSRQGATSQSAINLPILLSRVGGNGDFAAEILEHFVRDNIAYRERFEKGFRGSPEERDFFFRTLRTSASAIGGDELYALASSAHESGTDDAQVLAALTQAMAKTLQEARELRHELVGSQVLTEEGEEPDQAADRDEAEKTRSGGGKAGAGEGAPQDSPKGQEGPEAPTDSAASKDTAGGDGWTEDHGGADSAGPHAVQRAVAAAEALATPRARILVVDDSSTNRAFVKSCLEEDYDIDSCDNGRTAIEKARTPPKYQLILLDITMAGLDGYETCRLLKEDPRTSAIPVIFLTSQSRTQDEEKGLDVGAMDYIRKPFSVPILKARIKTQLELQGYRGYLEQMVEARTRALRETQREVVFRLALAAEYRDNDTGTHIKRIGYYSMSLADRLHLGQREADTLYFASTMHDIGKIGIPDRILLKEGPLDEEEWAVMKTHTTIGASLLGGQSSELLRMASTIALTHHEKWNGSGYPQGLAGEDIPLVGRIVAIVDVYDALCSERPYKRRWTSDEALDEINRLSGSHFDPMVVKAFNDSYGEILQINLRFRD